MSKIKQDLRPLGHPKTWARTPEDWLKGKAHIDGVDAVAIAMEARWGAGRLRLLVDDSLREKFDRQRFLFNAAIWHGDMQAGGPAVTAHDRGLAGASSRSGGRRRPYPVPRGLGGRLSGRHRSRPCTQS